MAAVVRGP